jgi:endonuclease/exonuclease/phosphatase family metal-dependent hydrolase
MVGCARGVRLRSVAIVAVAIAVIGTLAFDGARATTDRQTYLQFNICGNACVSGALGVVENLADTIRRRRPAAVTLNEVCENQYDRLTAGLAAYRGRFDPTGPRCRNGERYGNVVLIRTTSAGLVGSWELPSPAEDETRRLMCLGAHVPPTPRLVVCVTHISNTSANVSSQVQAVAGHLRGLASADTDAVLLGGDLNADPSDPRLDPLYGTCDRPGIFHEVDSAGCESRSVINQASGSDVVNEDTYRDHKFDYIFLSAGDWSSFAADATTEASDHDALWATATLHSPDPLASA